MIQIWDSETAEAIASFTVPGDVVNINWSPGGEYIIATGNGLREPVIKRVWTSTDDLMAYAYECCVTRDLTPEERAQFGLPAR